MASREVPIDLVLRELRREHFAVLSTADASGNPHSAGVNYGITPTGRPLALYIMTRTHLAKARNVAQNPRVALVVPLPRRLLWFLPPASIQIHGEAEVLGWDDSTGTAIFREFWLGRRILAAYERSRRRGETRVCFLKITPYPIIHTYMVGRSVWEISRDMESGAGITTLAHSSSD